MGSHFIAYIDEAGDEGLGKLCNLEVSGQSRWLVLGGLLVRKENDSCVASWRDEALAATMHPTRVARGFVKGKRRSLHFKDLKHPQRVAVCEAIKEKRFGIACVCSNKITIAENPNYMKLFLEKGKLYNYLTRFLLERLTSQLALIKSDDGQAHRLTICFSRRGGTDYRTMKEYFELMRDGKEVKKPIRSIDWRIFSPDDICVENHSMRAGLQLADVITSATYNALNPNPYGHCEPRYALSLSDRFLRKNSIIRNHGLTLVPTDTRKCPLTKEQNAFLVELERKAQEKWQTPGS